jgi:hypothetical protein
MSSALARAIFGVPWLAPTLAVLVTVVPALNIAVCYSLSRGDAGDGDGSLVTISEMGGRGAAHGVFASLFALTALLMVPVMELRRSQFEIELAHHGRVPTGALRALGWAALAAGYGALPFLLIMAFVSVYANEGLHLTGAFTLFGLISLYELLQFAAAWRFATLADSAAPGFQPGWVRASLVIFAFCFAVGSICVIVWISGSVPAEYAAATLPFGTFLCFAVDFARVQRIGAAASGEKHSLLA